MFQENANRSTQEEIKAEGVIQKPQFTKWQYGTHTLTDGGDKVIYALQSNTVNLDRSIDQQVVVYGVLVSGFPVDGGPDLLEVSRVQGVRMPSPGEPM